MDAHSLISKILEANTAYRRGSEIMSDAEYDALLDMLKDQYPDQYETVRLMVFDQDTASSEDTINLPVVVGSLEKLKNGSDSDISSWDESQKEFAKDYVISSKVDGLSILVFYYDGEIKFISTRGDGEIGELKTKKLLPMIPNNLSGDLSKGVVIIRGECVIKDEAFHRLNEMGRSYKAKRSAAVGIVNGDDKLNQYVKFLSFIAYQIYRSEKEFKTYNDVLETLKNTGFEIPKYEIVKHGSLNSIVLMELYENHYADEDFDIDGLVIQCNETFNECDKKIPEHSIAFKANQLVSPTEIIGYDWELSKDGSMRPIAKLNPVIFNGAEITRASAYNKSWIENMKAGIGAKVRVQMQGDIIPGIVMVVEESTNFDFPTKCPYCGEELVVRDKFMWCTNRKCKGRQVKSLAHFLKNLDIGFAGETNLANWKIFTIPDLVAFIPSGKQQEKFAKELEIKLWNIPEKKLLESFDYSGIGSKTISKIISKNGLEKFVKRFFCGSDDGTMSPEYGDVSLELSPGITNDTFCRISEGVFENSLINSYYSIIYDDRWHKKFVEKVTSTVLNGKSFCFTGAMSISRKTAETLVKQNGGVVKTSVTNKLDYLVTNDTNSGSTKNKAARECGTNIIDENKFFEMVNYELPANLKTVSQIKKMIDRTGVPKQKSKNAKSVNSFDIINL